MSGFESKYTKSVADYHSKARKEEVLRNFKTISLESLNSKQLKVINIVKEHIKDRTALRLLVVGEAGTGKSHTIFALKELFAKTKTPYRAISFTGVASSNVAANTVHSTFNLGFFSPLEPGCEPRKFAHISKVKFLIIDEISTVGKRLLGFVSERLKIIFRNQEPYGGISVVAFGDLCQLKPVADITLFKQDEDLPNQSIARRGELAYQAFNQAVVLQEQMRVSGEDKLFKDLLRRIRIGILTPEDLKLLNSRQIKKLTPNELDEFVKEGIIVFPSKADVNQYNEFRLKSTGEKIYTIPAVYSQSAPTELKSSLTLSVKTPVMLTHNINVRTGLYNGSVGYVTEFSDFDKDGIPRIIFVKFKKYFGKPYQARVDIPILRADIPEYCHITNMSWTKKQFPLQIYYASTYHKVQGLTLNKIVVSLGSTSTARAMLKRESPQLIYTALSRVRRLKDLALTSEFDPTVVTRGAHCLRFMEEEERLRKLELENENRNNLIVNLYS